MVTRSILIGLAAIILLGLILCLFRSNGRSEEIEIRGIPIAVVYNDVPVLWTESELTVSLDVDGKIITVRGGALTRPQEEVVTELNIAQNRKEFVTIGLCPVIGGHRISWVRTERKTIGAGLVSC